MGSDAYRLRGVVGGAEEIVPWVLDLHARCKVLIAGTITFVPPNQPNKHHEAKSDLIGPVLPPIWPVVDTPHMTPNRQSVLDTDLFFTLWTGMCT